jgi:WD40 repeat protein
MVQRFLLRGNFEPEAFSADHRGLYMISYVPPAAPDSYRVVRLDLHRGTVSPVYGRSKAPPETMTGTRLMQVPSADGTKLFTLYTSQPASYAAGYDSWQANSSHPVAFVHTLSLKNSWAVCVPLPGAFGTGDPRDEALAASPDGSLFVIDTRKRLIAVMDPRKLKVVRTARVDFGSLGVEQTHAAVSPDGRTLLVSTGESVVTIDTQSLRRHRTWNLSGIVDGLGFSSDGKRLFVVGDGEVRTLDPVTGDERRTIRAPGATGLEYVGAVDR